MKNAILALIILMSMTNAFSQSFSDVSTAVILSPFVTATKILETTTVAVLKTIESTKSAVQARGVAGKEQLKDELVALNEAILAGQVKTITDVQQPALRELFEEILQDEKQLEDIYSIVTSGSELHRVATVITISLMID